MNRLLHATFDRFPRLVESRYDQAFVYLNSRCRKRSLVILLTNVIDEVNANQVGQYLTRLVGRHLAAGRAAARPRDLRRRGEPAADDAVAVSRCRRGRNRQLASRRAGRHGARKGVLSLDVFPEQMTAPLVNRYLEIKARHLL